VLAHPGRLSVAAEHWPLSPRACAVRIPAVRASSVRALVRAIVPKSRVAVDWSPAPGAATLDDVIERIPPDWRTVLAAPLAEPWVAEPDAFLVRQYAEHPVYPPAADVFAALCLTPFASVRAVILGQDPYDQPDRAHGLAFSVPSGVKIPGSLSNILAEWARDLGRPIPTDGSLVPWAQHGVLLLNTVLTVRRGEPTSHAAR
jgi:Uracil DNA glycosylase superfamily